MVFHRKSTYYLAKRKNVRKLVIIYERIITSGPPIKSIVTVGAKQAYIFLSIYLEHEI